MKIYIAGPYGRRRKAPPIELDRNVQMAVAVARRLILKGHIVYVPHLLHYIHAGWRGSPDEATWASIGIAFLPFCDALFRISGFSRGSDAEVKIAKLAGMPIYYDLEEVPSGKPEGTDKIP